MRLSRSSLLSTLVVVGLLSVALVAPSTARAAEAKAAEPAAATGIDELLAKRKAIAEQIATLNAKDTASAEADATEISSAEEELEFLETLDGIYAQQQARYEQLQELQAEKKKADADLDSLHKFGPSDPKPYSFLLLETLRDALAVEEDHAEAYAADLKAAEQQLEAAHEHVDDAEKERRHAQEELTDNEDKEAEAELQAALELAKRQCQIAKELILVRRAEVEVRTLRQDTCKTLTTLLSEKVELIGRDVRFTKHDLQERLKDLKEYSAELTKKLNDARSRFQKAEAQQAAAIEELRKAKAPQATIDLANDSWRVARDGQQTEVSLLNERISDIKRFDYYWTCRYEVENGTAKPGEIAEWHESLSDLVDEMHENRRSLEQRIDRSRTEQGKAVQRIRVSDDPMVKQWGEAECTHWQELRDVCEEHLVQLKVGERWSNRFLDELHDRLEPPGEDWWALARKELDAAWDYEIAAVDDQPITIGKIIRLIGYILTGLVVASIVSRILGRHVLPRFGLNEGASRAMQTIAFYCLAALLGVWSFEIVHIPLTAFAFLGGAVAIAVGFGSQEIASNFMSGIIILAERPIRVGDVVEVDGVQGTVRHIGPRSTWLNTESNHEVIVPNSKLLSDRLTNLTLSDSLIQTAVGVTLPVKVGVRQAKNILLQAASSHPTVLHQPAPIVLFKQFGSTSMDFELHFWMQLTDSMEAAIAQSDVRETISELCQEADAQPIIATLPNPSAAPASTIRPAKAA